MTTVATSSPDIRAQLMSELKSAMKSKDTFKSTTIRSALAEVYAADKARPELVSSSVILSILRKAAVRRTDAAKEYEKASRPDLAEKEKLEANLLQSFLPPLLSEADVDRILRETIADQSQLMESGTPSKKAQGLVFKAFYAKVDKLSVDTDLVKRRAEALLSEKSA
ncbi:GatB/YqeY domain-containing protein [Sparassis crispa]|uniref:Altered inheritance of mitochondria protein 41 n=1 Tax=Sparassis crispa TaxID=139825 RepID=A0A401GGN2_9APHY|nr:GatB/YqeY domain-containing protein [Sparassis crispa]GBE81354.1 GatB/YqeY domain-containing protein [Sparassis crispa]